MLDFNHMQYKTTLSASIESKDMYPPQVCVYRDVLVFIKDNSKDVFYEESDCYIVHEIEEDSKCEENKKNIDLLISNIENYSLLEEDWDGYGADPISRYVVDDVVIFLRSMPDDIALPTAAPSADQEILLSWKKENSTILISFLEIKNFIIMLK